MFVQASSELVEVLDTLLLVYRVCMCIKNKCKAQGVDNCKSCALSKWKWQLCAIYGIIVWTKALMFGSKPYQLCKYLIMEWETSLRPAKQRLCSLGLNLNFGSSWNGLKSKWEIANFISSILPTQEWSQGVLGHFGKLEMFYTTYLWISFKYSPLELCEKLAWS